ncbi:Hypothetical predicted protein [Cloeon dipterum]|uniref:BPTI/Kunitz inhibitor domain-containing protein n=1 Tax=Cloeon dipterum TaxID=197152 RepID=A0A8S1BZW2_9INSE|nr:Hypothetical predicted protein [Cloeon dipterum]
MGLNSVLILFLAAILLLTSSLGKAVPVNLEGNPAETMQLQPNNDDVNRNDVKAPYEKRFVFSGMRQCKGKQFFDGDMCRNYY